MLDDNLLQDLAPLTVRPPTETRLTPVSPTTRKGLFCNMSTGKTIYISWWHVI